MAARLSSVVSYLDPEEVSGEGSLHTLAREGQSIALWTVRVLLVVTIITMVTFWFWAVIPAMLLVVAFLALLVMNVIERRSDRHNVDETKPVAPSVAARTDVEGVVHEGCEEESHDEKVASQVLRHETLIVGAGIAAVVLLAGVLASVFFVGPMIPVAVLFLVAYVAFITTPVWLAAIEDDIEDETARLAQGE
jgi:cobalamin synthase